MPDSATEVSSEVKLFPKNIQLPKVSRKSSPGGKLPSSAGQAQKPRQYLSVTFPTPLSLSLCHTQTLSLPLVEHEMNSKYYGNEFTHQFAGDFKIWN